jgi:predicted amidohydrolase
MMNRPTSPFVLLLLVAGLCACPSPEPEPDPGACGGFGVVDAVPVPETCPLVIADDGEDVRVFAVGQVLRYREMVDYAAFCEAWDEVVRREVVPCLADDRPNLLVFPENAALAAAFIGSRGADARAADDTLAGFLRFFEPYQAAMAFYEARWPELSPNQLLLLALSDTLARAFETFSEIARRYGVYVVVSTDLAPTEPSADPDALAALADPDLEPVAAVHVATEPRTYNWGVYYGPDGEEIDRVAKVYLVPDEEALLELTHGDITKMRPVALPFARTGMVISKDAWMPDVVARLDALGADLMLQPEAFSEWATPQYEGDWLPDVFTQSSWAHTQRHGAFRYNVTPCIKGNLLSLAYDCQSHIVKAGSPEDPPAALIGQTPRHGWLAIEPWAIDEPDGDLETRRAILREHGARLLPGSGDPLEDAYANQTLAADLFLHPDGLHPAHGDGAAGAFGESAPVLEAAGEVAHQRFPEVASDGSTILVAFGEGGPGGGTIRLARSDDGGLTFAPVALPASPAGTVSRTPAVALAGDRHLVVFEEEVDAEFSQVVALSSLDGGTTWTRDVLSGETAPAWGPAAAVDAATGRLHAAWLDLRHGLRPKPYAAHSDDGATWTVGQVDPANATVDDPRGNAAQVRIVAQDGTVHVAFNDFRRYAWDLYLATSIDAGASFEAAVRVNPPARFAVAAGDDVAVELERLHADLFLVLDAEGVPLLAHGNLQDRRPETHAGVLRGDTFFRVDDAPAGIDAFRPTLAVGLDGTWQAVWQDHRSGAARIRYASGEIAELSQSVVLDDADPRAHAVRPRIALSGDGAVVVWEDYRDGAARVRFVAVP